MSDDGNDTGNYARQLFRKGWVVVAAALSLIVAAAGGLSDLLGYADKLGIPTWVLVAGGLLTLTGVVHYAQYSLWKGSATKLASIDTLRHLLSDGDGTWLRNLRTSLSTVIAVTSRPPARITPQEWKKITDARDMVRTLFGSALRLGNIEKPILTLMEIMDEIGDLEREGLGPLEYLILNGDRVNSVARDVVDECDRLLTLHRQAAYLLGESS